MIYFKPSADASDQYRPTTSAPLSPYTPTAVQGNLSDVLKVGYAIVQPPNLHEITYVTALDPTDE